MKNGILISRSKIFHAVADRVMVPGDVEDRLVVQEAGRRIDALH